MIWNLAGLNQDVGLYLSIWKSSVTRFATQLQAALAQFHMELLRCLDFVTREAICINPQPLIQRFTFFENFYDCFSKCAVCLFVFLLDQHRFL